MTVTVSRLLLGSVYFIIGLVLAYLFPYTVGNMILALPIAAGSSFRIIVQITQFLLMIIMGLVVPLILFTNINFKDTALKYLK